MKICFVSDLHIDTGHDPKIDWPEADVLVIAGDTANSPQPLFELLKEAAALYRFVFFVDGNHEHYCNAREGLTVKQRNEILRREENAFFLPDSPGIRIADHYFIGINGWYSFDYIGDPIANRALWKRSLNDDPRIGFSVIEQPQPWDLALDHADAIHSRVAAWVAVDPDAKFVIVTHTAPHRDMVSDRPEFLSTNAFFVNQYMRKVMDDFGDRITVWAHGHTHHRREKVIDGVYCLANPRGYPGENPSWEPVVIDI